MQIAELRAGQDNNAVNELRHLITASDIKGANLRICLLHFPQLHSHRDDDG